jgi:aryl-alcohol dehydrogenase-like predicted oxidoreductase
MSDTVVLEPIRLGASGLEVSPLCLGCMSFGIPDRGGHPWSLGRDQAEPLLRRAVQAGITFFDTANVYSDGTSEEIVGPILTTLLPREQLVLATKVFNRMRPGANGAGLSRKAIMQELDASLRRLGVDYIDLYQIHRWDPHTPVEETMSALHDCVESGKVRYIGASNTRAWQFAKAQETARVNNWTTFVSMQDHYNLLNREEEREMLPLCLDQGVGSIPWSPLARGRLTRAWDETTARSETDEFGKTLYQEGDRVIVEAVAKVAAGRGVSMATVALSWVMRNPAVSAPIVGVTRPQHIDDAVAAVGLQLDGDEVSALEAPYTPHEMIAVL